MPGRHHLDQCARRHGLDGTVTEDYAITEDHAIAEHDTVAPVAQDNAVAQYHAQRIVGLI